MTERLYLNLYTSYDAARKATDLDKHVVAIMFIAVKLPNIIIDSTTSLPVKDTIMTSISYELNKEGMQLVDIPSTIRNVIMDSYDIEHDIWYFIASSNNPCESTPALH